jgi:hypothetical protein
MSSFMQPRRIGLINRSSKTIDFTEIASVVQALQTQIDRDFSAIWGIRAQILSLHQNDPIPHGVWPISVVNTPVGGLGIHLDKNSKPYAQVKNTADWSITASHELLEMLVDPYGHRFVQGPDIDPTSDGHLVSYLVEVGDPCEVYFYNIGNVRVSDFVTVEYYNANAPKNDSFDFLRRLLKPYEVPKGCYISWQDPRDQRWHQKRPNGKFIRSESKVNDKKNPRDDRDAAFGKDEENVRHDLPKLLMDYHNKGK